MDRALATTALHAFLWGFAIVFIALTLTGCFRHESDYWGAVSREMQKMEQSK